MKLNELEDGSVGICLGPAVSMVSTDPEIPHCKKEISLTIPPTYVDFVHNEGYIQDIKDHELQITVRETLRYP